MCVYVHVVLELESVNLCFMLTATAPPLTACHKHMHAHHKLLPESEVITQNKIKSHICIPSFYEYVAKCVFSPWGTAKLKTVFAQQQETTGQYTSNDNVFIQREPVQLCRI